MNLTATKIKEAQAVIEAVMAKTGAYCVLIYAPNIDSDATQIELGITQQGDGVCGENLNDLYINRLHELSGTEPPPF